MGRENFAVRAKLDGSNAVATQYLLSDKIDDGLGRIDVGGTTEVRWTLTDFQKSVRTILDGTGAVIGDLAYDAFGNKTLETAPTQSGEYGYTGGEWDKETELQYNRARWYDPKTARWLTQDPLGFDAGDSNVYRYVSNRATMAVDPSGLQFDRVPGSNHEWIPVQRQEVFRWKPTGKTSTGIDAGGIYKLVEWEEESNFQTTWINVQFERQLNPAVEKARQGMIAGLEQQILAKQGEEEVLKNMSVAANLRSVSHAKTAAVLGLIGIKDAAFGAALVPICPVGTAIFEVKAIICAIANECYSYAAACAQDEVIMLDKKANSLQGAIANLQKQRDNLPAFNKNDYQYRYKFLGGNNNVSTTLGPLWGLTKAAKVVTKGYLLGISEPGSKKEWLFSIPVPKNRNPAAPIPINPPGGHPIVGWP